MKTKSDLHLFSLFVSLGMGQEKDLTASMLGWILSTTLKKGFILVLQYIPPFT
ncbi:hypothetical protein bmyco0003_10740 [Bacillus pseudomycoides]|nr:hypothetical protein bmyco0003_10740 [Bacillus pseudomycoides]